MKVSSLRLYPQRRHPDSNGWIIHTMKTSVAKCIRLCRLRNKTPNIVLWYSWPRKRDGRDVLRFVFTPFHAEFPSWLLGFLYEVQGTGSIAGKTVQLIRFRNTTDDISALILRYRMVASELIGFFTLPVFRFGTDKVPWVITSHIKYVSVRPSSSSDSEFSLSFSF
jgi:hypothetical protein